MTDAYKQLRVMLTESEIQARAKEIAQELDKRFEGKIPVAICILKGSILFFSDLIRCMKTDMEVDFMRVSSYGNGTVSTGDIKILYDLSTDIKDRDVLIVEDIIDSGNTLYCLKKMLEQRGPSSITIVTMLDKPERRQVPMDPDYTCFVIEDKFVIGYGLDNEERQRNLPFVGVVEMGD